MACSRPGGQSRPGSDGNAAGQRCGGGSEQQDGLKRGGACELGARPGTAGGVLGADRARGTSAARMAMTVSVPNSAARPAGQVADVLGAAVAAKQPALFPAAEGGHGSCGRRGEGRRAGALGEPRRSEQVRVAADRGRCGRLLDQDAGAPSAGRSPYRAALRGGVRGRRRGRIRAGRGDRGRLPGRRLRRPRPAGRPRRAAAAGAVAAGRAGPRPGAAPARGGASGPGRRPRPARPRRG